MSRNACSIGIICARVTDALDDRARVFVPALLNDSSTTAAKSAAEFATAPYVVVSFEDSKD
jgi:hypothetical protein